jgi:hypothetical protein
MVSAAQVFRPAVMFAFALAALVCAACSDGDRARLKATTKATYDERTGRLKELTSDANGNGRIDTWTEMDGNRPLRSRQDRNEDGRLDRWEYYDDGGKLVKVGFSRGDNGKPDAWAEPGPDGKISRILVSSTGEESKIDRWETYDTEGQLRTAAFDENHDGRPDRRLTYQAGTLVLIETEPDASGQFTQRVDVK